MTDVDAISDRIVAVHSANLTAHPSGHRPVVGSTEQLGHPLG